jgi:hypothetical protein
MVPIARYFYSWTVKELMMLVSSKGVVIDDICLKQWEEQYECRHVFRAVPLNCNDVLDVVTGRLGSKGGKEALNTLIGEYAARPVTRSEVIERLINDDVGTLS